MRNLLDRIKVPLVVLVSFLLPLAAAVGWVWNIVKLAGMDAVTGMFALRIVGIPVAPLGAVLGYL